MGGRVPIATTYEYSRLREARLVRRFLFQLTGGVRDFFAPVGEVEELLR
jgi:hypothetical protein